MDAEFKPSLLDFLVDFQFRRVPRRRDGKAISDKERKPRKVKTSKASLSRKFIRENISNDTLEQIVEANQGRKDIPFYSLSCLKVKVDKLENGQEIISYRINVSDEELNIVYMDILDAIIKGYRKLERIKK